MTKIPKKTIRYSISFKQMVVQEIESGENLYRVSRKYSIAGSSTIQRWIKSFGKSHLLNKIVRIETMEDQNQVKELKNQVKELKLTLADCLLAQRSLEALIERANSEYKTDLKKSFGMKS